jgi:hypothetical protein
MLLHVSMIEISLNTLLTLFNSISIRSLTQFIDFLLTAAGITVAFIALILIAAFAAKLARTDDNDIQKNICDVLNQNNGDQGEILQKKDCASEIEIKQRSHSTKQNFPFNTDTEVEDSFIEDIRMDIMGFFEPKSKNFYYFDLKGLGQTPRNVMEI